MNIGSALSSADMSIVRNVTNFEQSIVGNILDFVRLWGSGLALIMLTYMSLAYFMADGALVPWGTEKKAYIKGDQLKNFAIGVIVFVAASNILYVVAGLADSWVGGFISSV